MKLAQTSVAFLATVAFAALPSVLSAPTLVARGAYCNNHLSVDGIDGLGDYSLEQCAALTQTVAGCGGYYFYYSAAEKQCKCATDDCSARTGGQSQFNIYRNPTPRPTNRPTTAAPTGAPTSAPVTSAPTGAPASAPVTSPPTSAPVAATFTVSPAKGGATGDPHFSTWGGDKYDFHGGCALVLLHNPGFANGLGLDIHIRTKIHTWWSFIETAVVRIGSDLLEVKGGDNNGGSYWINGVLGQDLNDGTLLSLSGFPVRYRSVSSKQNKFRVDLRNGDALSIETYKSFVRVNVKARNHDQFQGSSGLMGSFPGGVKLARDQTTVLKDVSKFGKEWQVLTSETMLFHSSEGVQHPQECTMPSATEKATKRRRLGESLLTEEDAAIACDHVDEDERDACIFDVLATNDKDMAGSY